MRTELTGSFILPWNPDSHNFGQHRGGV